MFARKVLSVILLVTFLPLATGCSMVQSVPIPDDPGGEDDPLEAEEPLAITGYTDVWGTDHDWNGIVEAAGADSLEFTSPAPADGNATVTGDPEYRSLRLPRDEIPTVLVEQPHSRWKRLAAGVVALGMIAAMVVIVWQNQDLDLDMDFASGYKGS